MDALLISPITMTTPLGAALTFHSMGGIETLSTPFHFEIEATSQRSDIHARDLLGESVTVHVDLGQPDDSTRHWNGQVTRFDYLETGNDGLSRYRLTVRPWLWQLGLSADCRIFQNLSIPDIVEQVFQNRGFTDFERSLFSEYSAHEYIVQYRESDLDFVSRLLEREGIYYFFRHTDGKHTLVLADSPHAHETVSGYETLPYAAEDENRDQTMQYVRRWRAESQLETARYSVADFDFTKPRARLFGSEPAHDDDFDTGSEAYDYPGGFDNASDASRYAQIRLQEVRRDGKTWVGETNARGLATGARFQLEEHPRADENRGYVLTAARVRLRGTDTGMDTTREESFVCTFRAVADDLTFRPPLRTRKPTVRGLQTAIVVGPDGQEIWTDQYGRVKVQFHWDRLGKGDETSSCWIRVAQGWAGANWGTQFVPRIGDEVIVDFLDGDVDRPIITGSVYNAASMPPFELPAHQTRSGLRTASTPDGSFMNGNVLRFEDKKGHEDLFVHAERTQTTVVKASQSIAVGGNRSLDVRGDQAEAIGKHRDTDVGIDDRLRVHNDREIQVDNNQLEEIGGKRISLVQVDATLETKDGSITLAHGDSILTIRADEDVTLVTKTAQLKIERLGNVLIENAGASITMTNDGDIRIENQKGNVIIQQSANSVTVKESAIAIESNAHVSIAVGGTTVDLTSSGVSVTASTIKLN